MFPRHTVPQCYGHLFDKTSVCRHCLLNCECETISNGPSTPLPTMEEKDIPRDRRLLVLGICSKYGISTTYYSKNLERDYTVTEENCKEFQSLNFLLRTKDALEKLFLARIS